MCKFRETQGELSGKMALSNHYRAGTVTAENNINYVFLCNFA